MRIEKEENNMTIDEITQRARELELGELRILPGIIEGMIAEREKAEKAAVRAELEAMAKAKGFNMGDLFGSSGKPAKEKKTVPPKYRNPADASQTWTGRGRKPKWIEAALNIGRSLDDFLIRD